MNSSPLRQHPSLPKAYMPNVGYVAVTGRLHGTIVGPTSRSDWSVCPTGRSDDRIV